MKGRKKPWNLPRLKPETHQAITELIGHWATSRRPYYFIHSRFLLSDHDIKKLYHSTNAYSSLLWFVKSIRQYEVDRDNGVHRFENRSDEISIGEFNEINVEREESYKRNLLLLRQIANVAKEAKDDAFKKHLAFARSFAEDRNGDHCLRLAVADVTRTPLPLGQDWTINLIVRQLRFWHGIELNPEDESVRKSLERDCKALKIKLKRGRAKKSDDKRT